MPTRQMVMMIVLLAWTLVSHAHKPSDSYLSIQLSAHGAELTGQWDIALRDLEHALGLDSDANAAITWGELKASQAALAAYAFSRLAIDSVDHGVHRSCPIGFEQLLVDQHVDGGYAVLRFSARCPARPTQLAINYSLLFDLDPDHRGLLKLQAAGGAQAAVFSRDRPDLALAVGQPHRWDQLRSFVTEGIWHILHGYDHVLFLLTLLLPAVVLHRRGGWEPRSSLRDALIDVTKVVTGFTLAHSITLSLGVLGWINLPSRIVESAIAFTVVLGALNNLFPLVTRRRWLVAFAFGLIHGLGFASVLRDLGLERGSLGIALLGFNVGVELGQLAIVVLFVPLIYLLRESLLYRRLVMPMGALAIGGIAAYWFVGRAFG